MQSTEKDENGNKGDQGKGADQYMLIPKELLPLENTRMAAERTLMAWIRTTLSMISFGFTIYKFIEVIQEQKSSSLIRDHTARNLGLMLIGIGTFALIMAIVQHYKYLKLLGLTLREKLWNLSFLVGCLIALLGLLMLVSVVFNAGPLS